MSVRQQKVSAQIRRIVSELLLRGVADPRVDEMRGLVSVTKVEVTPDLREARVYVSILTTQGTPATVFSGLKSATRSIQGAVAKALQMRSAPHLEFLLDETLKKEAELLKKIDEAMGGSARRESGAGQAT